VTAPELPHPELPHPELPHPELPHPDLPHPELPHPDRRNTAQPHAPQRVLALAAHPDDLDFGSAGTIASLVAGGASVSYCIATSGDAGGFDDTPRDQMGPLREAEQRAAAEVLGVADVTFLGYPDGSLTASMALRRDFSRAIRQVRPQLVIAPSPNRNLARLPASHPDHLAAGEAAINAIYPDARNPFAHQELLRDEGLQAWSVPELWLSGDEVVDHVVDITDQWDAKIRALRSHVSQVGHRDDLGVFLRAWATQVAEAAGLPEGRLAEGFRRVLIPV
jgi:LmbE family N-acetylglucosaminyl deacetylase